MKPLALLAMASALALATAVPAWAHAEISPSSVPTGKPVFLTLSAANEKSADLTRITLTAPEGLAFGHATREPAGWTAGAAGRALTWTGGTVAHDHFESWGFEIEGADQPGTSSYRVMLGYADGSSEEVEVPLTVTAAESAVGPVTTVPTPTTPTTAGGLAEPPATEPEAGTGQGRANVALAISVVALVAAVAAAVLAARRDGASAPAAPTPAQDW
jgi:uncharacterized protein YcnI